MKINLNYKPKIEQNALFKNTDIAVSDQTTDKILKKIFQYTLGAVGGECPRKQTSTELYHQYVNFILVCKKWTCIQKEEIFQIELIGDAVKVYQAIEKSDPKNRISMMVKLLKELSTKDLAQDSIQSLFKHHEYKNLMERGVTDNNLDLMHAALTFNHFDASCDDNSFINAAARMGDLPLIKKLLKRKEVLLNLDNKPIRTAILNEHFEVVAELLKYANKNDSKIKNLLREILALSSKKIGKETRQTFDTYLNSDYNQKIKQLKFMR